MLEVLIALRTRSNIDREVTQFRGVTIELQIAIERGARGSRIHIHAHFAKSLQGRIEDHRCRLIGATVFARGALHAESPAPSMLATWHLDEIDREIQIISSIMNCLSSALPHIIFVPAVPSHTLILFAGVSKVFNGCQPFALEVGIEVEIAIEGEDGMGAYSAAR